MGKRLSKLEDDLVVLEVGEDYTLNALAGKLVILSSYLDPKLTSAYDTVELIIAFNQGQGNQHELRIIIAAIGTEIK